MLKSMLNIMLLAMVFSSASAKEVCPKALDFHKRPLGAENTVHLCQQFKDKVTLVVNTASKCAYTYQYEGLEALYEKYKGRGLIVAGFPSNDFAGQEPGTEKQIQSFCRLTYGVQFPMFEKTRVKSPHAGPFYQFLGKVTSETPKWNFHKYLINRKGEVVGSFPSQVEPDNLKLISAIEKLL